MARAGGNRAQYSRRMQTVADAIIEVLARICGSATTIRGSENTFDMIRCRGRPGLLHHQQHYRGARHHAPALSLALGAPARSLDKLRRWGVHRDGARDDSRDAQHETAMQSMKAIARETARLNPPNEFPPQNSVPPNPDHTNRQTEPRPRHKTNTPRAAAAQATQLPPAMIAWRIVRRGIKVGRPPSLTHLDTQQYILTFDKTQQKKKLVHTKIF